MINKVMDAETALSNIKSGCSVMMGGFGNNGAPINLIYALAKHKEINNLTLICEGFELNFEPPVQESRLVANGQISHLITTFLGGNPTIAKAMDAGMKVSFFPQGTFADKIHAGGAGLGGFYTPTGVGTVVEEGKETKVINGKKYILEEPLRADVAIVKCHTVDTRGNAFCKYSSRNFNPLMAMAADYVILECEKIVEPGEIDPDLIHIPGVFVDAIVLCEEVNF